MTQNIKLWVHIFALIQLVTKGGSTGDFKRGVLRELWQSVQGNYVANFTSSSRYQDSPDIKDAINHFSAPWNIGDNYGQRLTSFYRAPKTGAYIFYMACLDECELWLSSTEKPDDMKRILFVPYGLNLSWRNDWERYPVQISSPINLFSGEFYFMQAIMKVGVNTHEHLGVGVRLPDGQKHRPIVIDYLYCEIPEKKSVSFRLVQGGAALEGHVMYTRVTNSNTVCSLYCARDLNCQSYNYDQERSNCELNDDVSVTNTQRLVLSEGVDYYEKMDLHQSGQ